LIEALKLPRVIGNDKLKMSPKMSRLVAVGVVRSVAAKMRQKEGGLEMIREFRGHLAAAIHKQRKAFEEIVNEQISEEEFGFSPIQFITTCEQLHQAN
jgi:hypothetical protein